MIDPQSGRRFSSALIGNCAEGVLADPPPGELSPCTLMINAVDLASLNFSTPNGLVVRGHMEAFAP